MCWSRFYFTSNSLHHQLKLVKFSFTSYPRISVCVCVLLLAILSKCLSVVTFFLVPTGLRLQEFYQFTFPSLKQAITQWMSGKTAGQQCQHAEQYPVFVLRNKLHRVFSWKSVDREHKEGSERERNSSEWVAVCAWPAEGADQSFLNWFHPAICIDLRMDPKSRVSPSTIFLSTSSHFNFGFSLTLALILI